MSFTHAKANFQRFSTGSIQRTLSDRLSARRLNKQCYMTPKQSTAPIGKSPWQKSKRTEGQSSFMPDIGIGHAQANIISLKFRNPIRARA
jgi:hypothetical protein